MGLGQRSGMKTDVFEIGILQTGSVLFAFSTKSLIERLECMTEQALFLIDLEGICDKIF